MTLNSCLRRLGGLGPWDWRQTRQNPPPRGKRRWSSSSSEISGDDGNQVDIVGGRLHDAHLVLRHQRCALLRAEPTPLCFWVEVLLAATILKAQSSLPTEAGPGSRVTIVR